MGGGECLSKFPTSETLGTISFGCRDFWDHWVDKYILRDPGVDSEGEGKAKWAEKYGTKKSKERPLGTMSYQTSSKELLSF